MCKCSEMFCDGGRITGGTLLTFDWFNITLYGTTVVSVEQHRSDCIRLCVDPDSVISD